MARKKTWACAKVFSFIKSTIYFVYILFFIRIPIVCRVSVHKIKAHFSRNTRMIIHKIKV